MEHHIGNVRNSRPHQLFAHGEGHQGSVLAEDEQVEGIALSRRRLHQILMPQGEGVGVHHKRPGNALGFRLFQGFQVAGKAVFPVFHEDQGAVHPGNFIKAQVAEKPGGIHLGIQKQVKVPPCHLYLHQVGNDFVQQALPLVLPAHREAAQGTAKAAAGGDDLVVFIPHGADVI